MQAEMNVHAVARAVGNRHRREDGAVAKTEGRGAHEFTRDHRLVCCLQRRLRRDSEFVLALAIFGQEGIRLEPSGAKRCDQSFRRTRPGARQAPRL